MKLKETINLPKTKFPMKASLSTMEPKLLQRWDELQLYQRIRSIRKMCPSFTLHDGPPYANGNIHIGHAENKILKDFILKSKTMKGLNAPYIPGWDCHGLPIEIKVDQALGKKKSEMTQGQIRQECRKYADKFVQLQRQEFIRLGILGDWKSPYLTMSASYEAAIARTFGQFVKGGSVYKGLKPVHWCISCRTALAEAEVQYQDHQSPAIYVKFPLASDPSNLHPALKNKKVSVLIWTTTPWTLPANLGVAFNANLEYSVVEVGEEAYLIASDLIELTAKQCDFKPSKTLACLRGEELANLKIKHPFLNQISPGLLGDHVTLEQGTGCVHTAPGHGHEDYTLGKAYQLEIYCPVDDSGYFLEGTPYVEGQAVFEANNSILQLLRDQNALLGVKQISHSYPHCWRCHNPVIFRATSQWFISMDHGDLRKKALSAIQTVHWIPQWGQERISKMIANRPDWCISRQRVWGVPIIALYCKSCQNALLKPEIVDHVVNIFEREGADAWFNRPVEDLIPANIKCPKCDSIQFYKETDILDVWFDSGSSQTAVLGQESGLAFPADVYMEGSDQYRGWFHSSLLVGIGTSRGAPYRQVLTHGWTLDADGKAMSKSLGNVIEPQTIIKKEGAEILRLWIASSDFKEDIRISEEMIQRLSEGYRKFRNTARFMLGNLSDFSPSQDSVAPLDLEEIDQWALMQTSKLLDQIYSWYDNYEFHRIYHNVNDFLTTELSAFYFDILKDRLYTTAASSPSRRSAQTVIYQILESLTCALAPIYSFTCDEIWEYLPSNQSRLESVHMANFIPANQLVKGFSPEMIKKLENWKKLVQIRSIVLKNLEDARKSKVIGNSLEAKVILILGGQLDSILESYQQFLPSLFIVSQVELNCPTEESQCSPKTEDLRVIVSRADGEKCERCWNYSLEIGRNPAFSNICLKCSEVLKKIGVHTLEPTL